ncbi:ankyrin repeat domain-containing protein [Mucilaginibacter sp. AW1-3]
MKTIKILTLVLFITLSHFASAQEMPAAITAALKTDDASALSPLLNKDNLNTCYGNYCILADAIRYQADACFSLLLDKGADVNKVCNGYLPPLMHACKYGTLETVKALIAKGAKKDFTYDGSMEVQNGPKKGDTPLIYAQRYHHDDIADYLKSLK